MAYICPLDGWNEIIEGIYVWNFQQGITWYEIHVTNWERKSDGFDSAIATLYAVDSYIRRNYKTLKMERYLRRTVLASNVTIAECLKEAEAYAPNMID